MAATFLEKTVEMQELMPGPDLLRRRMIQKKDICPEPKPQGKRKSCEIA
jgi:hypothetical protein